MSVSENRISVKRCEGMKRKMVEIVSLRMQASHHPSVLATEDYLFPAYVLLLFLFFRNKTKTALFA